MFAHILNKKDEPPKILILKPSSLGDVIHALPVARMLHHQIPALKIYWWIDIGLAPLLETDPDLAGLFLFDRKNWYSLPSLRSFAATLQSMRRFKFDLAIDLQALLRSALVGYLSGANYLIGLNDPREGASLFYNVSVPRPSPRTHAVDWCLGVVDLLGISRTWEFVWLPLNRKAAESVNRRLIGLEGTKRIALLPGASRSSKRWPTDRFAMLLHELANYDKSLHFLIIGSQAERQIALQVAAAAPRRSMVLAGELSLPELVELLRTCSLLIGNDSGPLHIAAALRRPVVAIFGPTDPCRTGPYGQPHNVLTADLPCQPCLMRHCPLSDRPLCLEKITVDKVFEAVRGLLSKNSDFSEAPWQTMDQTGRTIPGRQPSNK